jgi:hypothetical protein
MSPIDGLSVVTWVTVALGAGVMTLGALTLGLAFHYGRRSRRLEACKPAVTRELSARLNESDPEWCNWVGDLSEYERRAARAVAERLLRQVRGSQRRDLRALVAELGVDEPWLRQRVTSGKLYTKLRTLSWLALLDYPAVVSVALRTCTGTSKTRAALARVLHENDDPRSTRTGVDLLLWERTKPLSVFGLDTLYRITNRDPSYLLSVARSDAKSWADSLLVQVLTDIRHCQTTIAPRSIEWVTGCLDHDSPEVRSEALLVLAEYGWHTDLQSRVGVESHLADRSPKVRRAAYRLVGARNDGEALSALASAVQSEADGRSRLVGIRELRRLGWRVEPMNDPSPTFRRTWRWVSAGEQVCQGES